MTSMSERTYVVTGSASGIGAATAARLQASGHRVVGVDLRDADVIADLATKKGRRTLVDQVRAADRRTCRRRHRLRRHLVRRSRHRQHQLLRFGRHVARPATVPRGRAKLRAPPRSVPLPSCNRSTTTSSTPACATTKPLPVPPPKARACSCTRRRNGRWRAGSGARPRRRHGPERAFRSTQSHPGSSRLR